MKNYLVLALLILFTVPSYAQKCGEIYPTLHDYRIAKDGASYLKGRLVYGTIRDGDECEIIRLNMSTWRCRWAKGKKIVSSRHYKRLTKTNIAGLPDLVAQAQKRRANQVGGEGVAKQRSIRAAWDLYREKKTAMEMARQKMLAAEVPYRKLVTKLKRKGCRNPTYGIDPILGK